MPYVLVETIDAIGNKELLAAPETWIQRNDDGTVYLCWPNIRNITMLNKLLVDERSSPTTEWELHKCVIKCSNIQSLSVAGKMIKTLQNHWKSVGSAQKRAIEADDNLTPEPACKKSPINSGGRQHAQANSKNVHTEEFDPEELQVIGMFNELRNLIQNKHAEARKKLHDGLYRVHKSLHSLVDVSPMTDSQNKEQEVVSDNAPGCSGIALEFYVNPLTCIDEMSDFEKRLNDEDYRKQVQTWIDCTVDHESHSERRMRGILDSLFDQQFLSNFSWNGGNTETHAFMKYENIVNLFKYAGTIAGSIVTTQCVQEFLTNILQAGLTAMEKQASPSLVPIDSKILLDDVTVLQTVECTNENTLTDDNDSQKSDYSIMGVNPLTCIEEMDAFEAKLKEAGFRARMHKWIDECVAHTMNPEIRMLEILYLLFDRNFLVNFTWVGAKKGSYGMKKYNNVVQLFQYVGTTATHRADYMFVANFFIKKLRYAGR